MHPIGEVGSTAHQASSLRKLAQGVDGRQTLPWRKINDLTRVRVSDRVFLASIGAEVVSAEAALSQEHGTNTRQRLAAILAADVAGYSRLMSANEQSTVVALDAARAVFRTQIETHHGRVVDMAGDSVLAVFETATGAVSAALVIQAQLEELAAGVPADRRMRFRIGVHMGDVIEKADGTVYGDGVNIAARLEGLALPGGVTISDAVQGAVRHRVAAAFEDLGDQQVKNIVDPIRAYRVLATATAGTALTGNWLTSLRVQRFGRRRWLVGVAVAISFTLIGVGTWVRQTSKDSTGEPITMSLAIGAIGSPANDASMTQLAETLRRNLSTSLGAVERNVRVVSVELQSKSAATPREVARAAGARYVVEGDLQTVPLQRLLNLRLIEAGSGTQAWSKQFDLPEEAGTMAAQVGNRKMVRHLARAVERAEMVRVARLPARQLDAMELVARAWSVLDQGQSVVLAKEARKYLDDALRIDPKLAPALIAVVWQLDMLNDVDPHSDHELWIGEMDEYSARAVTADPQNPHAWGWRAGALMLAGRWEASLEASDREVRLDPYSESPYSRRAWLLSMMGRPEEALHTTEKAVSLDPSYVGSTLRWTCEAYLLLGEAGKAITACERAGALDPNDMFPHSFLAAAYANAGDLVHAQSALAAMLKTVPGYTIAQLRAKRYSDHPEYQKLAEQYWYGGLRKAGLAEK